MLHLIGKGLVLLSFILLSNCSFFSGGEAFDSRSFSVQTLSLFSQRIGPRENRPPWKGDWVFRRDRLKLIDDELHTVKPDLLILQDVMERRKSPSEADRAILLAGALQSYDWESLPVREWEDTEEDQSLAVAADLPLKIQKEETIPGLQRVWMVGSDGYMAESLVSYEGDAIAIFNVQMPSRVGRTYLWYTFIQERIAAALKARKTCPLRIIVAGYLPANQDANRFNSFIEALQLKDASEGFCDVASKCLTATNTNDLFAASTSEAIPYHADRILVSRQAIVQSSSMNFSESHPASEYRELFGIEKLWPTARFGWLASIRFPKCRDAVAN